MLVAVATRTPEPIGPAGLLQGSLTLLLGDVEPLELRQGKGLLELDAAACHCQTSICVPVYGARLPCAEPAG
jgi:hypothetical protein